MRVIRLSFLQMMKFARRDMMLLAAFIAPVLAGIAIKFAVPAIELSLIRRTGADFILSPYYGLIDVFYASLTPVMFCFISAMIILEEHDDHIESYLFVTGLGRNGYVISRIVLPAIFSIAVTAVLLPLFGLASLSIFMRAFLVLTGTLQGVIIALLVVTLSSNKLEGMAVTKVSSLIMMGAFAPYFVPMPLGYMVSFLPSFWMGMAVCRENVLYMAPAVLTEAVWIMLLLRKFRKKF